MDGARVCRTDGFICPFCSVCAKRNIVYGLRRRRNIICNLLQHHFRQRLNLVHLCRERQRRWPDGQMRLRVPRKWCCAYRHKWKIRLLRVGFFGRGTGILNPALASQGRQAAPTRWNRKARLQLAPGLSSPIPQAKRKITLDRVGFLLCLATEIDDIRVQCFLTALERNNLPEYRKSQNMIQNLRERDNNKNQYFHPYHILL